MGASDGAAALLALGTRTAAFAVAVATAATPTATLAAAFAGLFIAPGTAAFALTAGLTVARTVEVAVATATAALPALLTAFAVVGTGGSRAGGGRFGGAAEQALEPAEETAGLGRGGFADRSRARFARGARANVAGRFRAITPGRAEGRTLLVTGPRRFGAGGGGRRLPALRGRLVHRGRQDFQFRLGFVFGRKRRDLLGGRSGKDRFDLGGGCRSGGGGGGTGPV